MGRILSNRNSTDDKFSQQVLFNSFFWVGYDGTYLLVILHQKFFDCLINHELDSRITSKNKRWAGTTPQGYQALFTANSPQPICKAIRKNVF